MSCLEPFPNFVCLLFVSNSHYLSQFYGQFVLVKTNALHLPIWNHTKENETGENNTWHKIWQMLSKAKVDKGIFPTTPVVQEVAWLYIPESTRTLLNAPKKISNE